MDTTHYRLISGKPEVLKGNRWNRTQAAKKLKMGRTTLWRKMKAYGFA